MDAKPIDWGRVPFDKQIVALVLRDGSPGFVDLAWDDGRPFLPGLRTVCVKHPTEAITAWCTVAAVSGVEIRDERAKPDVFAEADANNARAAVAARLEAKRREIEARRSFNPMPAGGLFDEVTRAQTELL